MAVIDTLKLARALRDQAGFTQNAADATAEALNAALGTDVATKIDIDSARVGLKADIDSVRVGLKAEIYSVRAGLKADIDSVRAGLKAEIDSVRAEIQATKAELKGDIRLLRWQIAVVYALQIAILVKLFVH